MILGIDLDGTYAADPACFRAVVNVFYAAGHQCVLVTNRPPEDLPIVDAVVQGQMPLVFANGRPKKIAAAEAGFFVNVWIDDCPILVDFGAMGLQMIGGSDR